MQRKGKCRIRYKSYNYMINRIYKNRFIPVSLLNDNEYKEERNTGKIHTDFYLADCSLLDLYCVFKV